ncbi:MAG: putative Holliday junction resolvase-like endonuclease [Saprospiraceae bacterium]|jgi:predicted Holliday junction resolvase-like endonuclease
MQLLKDFFIFCSGANRSILKRTPTEVNKYIGIGATIFFTGIFAFVAAAYALSTIFETSWFIIPVALLWGLMIFNLDRFIVSTMKKKGALYKDFTNALPRIVLAVLISIVIAKPLELKIFESEIEAELVKMQQENYKEQDDLVKDRYVASIDTLKSEVLALKQEIETKELERDAMVTAAIQEADGTGGSMNRNLGPIYKAKKSAADLVQSEYDRLAATNLNLITSKEDKIKTLDASMTTDMETLNRVSMTGFAARLEGLERASSRSKAIWLANLFIMLLFIAIETAPVITKLMIPRSPYDFVLDKHETEFETNHKAYTSRIYDAVEHELKFNRSTLEHKTEIAIKAERELADEAIKRRVEELAGKHSVTPDFLKRSSLFHA